jgi:hypothetical protein
MTMSARSQGRWSATNGISSAIQACHAPTVDALPGLPTRARLPVQSPLIRLDPDRSVGEVGAFAPYGADTFDDEHRAARRYPDRALALMLVPPRRPEHHRLPRTRRNSRCPHSAGQPSRSGNAAMSRRRCAPQLILVPRPGQDGLILAARASRPPSFGTAPQRRRSFARASS